MDTHPANDPGKLWPTYGVLILNAVLPSLVVILCLWPLAQKTGWRNYWFDDRYLYDQAATMQEHFGVLGDDPRELDAVRDRMPLYPLLLRGLRRMEAYTGIPVPAWSILTNVVAHGISVLLLYHLVLRLSNQRRLALMTALVWPWLPGVLPYTLAQLPEAVSTLLCLTCCLLLVPDTTRGRSWGRAAIAGVALGDATLFKPVFATFSVPCLILIWLGARSVKAPAFHRLLFFLVGFLATLAPWLVRNHHVWGKATLTPNGMAHVANARDAVAADLGLPAINPQVPKTDEGWRALGIDPADLHTRSVYRSRLAWADLVDHPLGFLKAAFTSVLKLHASTGVGALMTMSSGHLAVGPQDRQPEPGGQTGSTGWSALQIASWVVLGLTYVLTTVGLFALWKDPSRRILFWWAVLTLAYFVALSVPFGNTRYRYPAMPAYAALAAAGLTHCLQRWPRRAS